ncbi:hypothetical protein [Neobacillus cucumis]|uniref:Uncharacterized protein n=1 Tax=Neobacillus cucumis TaxID=1740721 RepID=A0A2N5HAC7_9BACI|nr:hypothetical protein [Neobacillus cucumis]PLS02473.1 hypothetical protein CVD27_20200 [Neobacillus cucumis]
MSQILNEKIPFTTVFLNLCNGEFIQAEGVSHVVLNMTPDGNGGFHLVSHDNFHATGTGDVTGSRYVVNGISKNTQNVKAPFPSTTTTISRLKVIAQKQGVPDFFTDFIVHITVNANGEVTAIKIEFDFDCN